MKDSGFKTSDIILGGFSLGSGIATDLVSNTKEDFNCLFLISPYSSIKNYAIELNPSLKFLYGDTNVFDSENKIKRVEIPTIIFAGKEDFFNPESHSKILYNNCKSKNKKIYIIENHGHNDVIESKEYKENLTRENR